MWFQICQLLFICFQYVKVKSIYALMYHLKTCSYFSSQWYNYSIFDVRCWGLHSKLPLVIFWRLYVYNWKCTIPFNAFVLKRFWNKRYFVWLCDALLLWVNIRHDNANTILSWLMMKNVDVEYIWIQIQILLKLLLK